MLKKILIAIAVVIAVFVAIVALQPADFSVSRSISISASADTVFMHVNNFHHWEAWSPWAKLDPEMKTTYTGSPEGAGASYAWEGNEMVGKGKMTITDSRASELIRIHLEFLEPFAATNRTEFTFKPAGNQTAVTWTMSGENNFLSKAMQLFMSMDEMIGGDFEKGLTQLKEVVEATRS